VLFSDVNANSRDVKISQTPDDVRFEVVKADVAKQESYGQDRSHRSNEQRFPRAVYRERSPGVSSDQGSQMRDR
jgi:hypothetical protein